MTSCILLFGVSCAHGDESNPAETADADLSAYMSIQDLPDMEKLKSWEPGKVNKLKIQISQFPLESCEAYFQAEIRTFLKEDENADADTVVIEQDSLSVIPGKNQKSLSNQTFHVDLVYDIAGDVKNYDRAKELANQVLEFLMQYSYYNLKERETDVRVVSPDGAVIHSLQSYSSGSDETAFVVQPEDEYAVQTLAFQFEKSNPEYQLQKFGVILGETEENELYVEYYVSDEYFDLKHMETSIADLEKTGGKIRDYLMSKERTKEFISSENIKCLTISFNSGNMDDSYKTIPFQNGELEDSHLTFRYEL